MKKYFIAAAVLFSVAAVMSCDRKSYVTITGYAQGGTYSVKLNMNNDGRRLPVLPEDMKTGIDSVLTAIDSSVSGYNKKSLLSRFNRGESIVPDSIFIDIYRKSYGYYRMTGGAVDVAAAPLFDVWGFGFTSDSLPSAGKVAALLKDVGMGRLYPDFVKDSSGRISPSEQLREGSGSVLPMLNYNAVAQGYSCDAVASYLDSLGVHDMLVNIGGEIFCRGLNPSGRPWSVGIDRPVDGNNTPGADMQGVFSAGPDACGIVTSGNYRKFYVRQGKKYAHTIDPRTGYPVAHSLLSATIVADNAALADALATYCMVIGLEEAEKFISSEEGIEGYLVYDDGGIMKSWASDGFTEIR